MIKIRLTATPMTKVMRPASVTSSENLVGGIISVAECLIEIALSSGTARGGLTPLSLIWPAASARRHALHQQGSGPAMKYCHRSALRRPADPFLVLQCRRVCARQPRHLLRVRAPHLRAVPGLAWR